MSEPFQQAGLTSAQSAGSASEYYFEFRGVNKAFDDRVVLNDVSFKVQRGETCRHHGAQRCGQIRFLETHHGFPLCGLWTRFHRRLGRHW